MIPGFQIFLSIQNNSYLLSYGALDLTKNFWSCVRCKTGIWAFERAYHIADPGQNGCRNCPISDILDGPTSIPHQSHAWDQPCLGQDFPLVRCRLWNKILISKDCKMRSSPPRRVCFHCVKSDFVSLGTNIWPHVTDYWILSVSAPLGWHLNTVCNYESLSSLSVPEV